MMAGYNKLEQFRLQQPGHAGAPGQLSPAGAAAAGQQPIDTEVGLVVGGGGGGGQQLKRAEAVEDLPSAEYRYGHGLPPKPKQAPGLPTKEEEVVEYLPYPELLPLTDMLARWPPDQPDIPDIPGIAEGRCVEPRAD